MGSSGCLQQDLRSAVLTQFVTHLFGTLSGSPGSKTAYGVAVELELASFDPQVVGSMPTPVTRCNPKSEPSVHGAAFRLLAALVFFGYFGHRAYYVRKVRHASGSVVRQLPDAVGPVILLFLSAVVIATFAVVPRWLGWASLPLPGALRWAGLGLAAAAFALLEWAQAALGRNWSLRVQLLEHHELVVSGPYRWVRHPMYTAGLLASLAVLLLSANWLAGGCWLLMHGWQFALRIPLEEGLMTRQFGDAYRRYVRTTGRLFPRILHRAS